ncbi:MFS transporter [Allopusillimonas ginsengisoli]|uniref:MFS transporter n=1 Tax=Allopusillimonas ginsengisoli TaxID=453575 RepID=UPI0010C183AD|nr:CynX/NimT family MFS transporter [Allopusillimonas ginsengisoli]
MTLFTVNIRRNDRARKILLVIGILLIAANLRAPFTSLAPLLNLIRESFSLSAAAAGMLTTLPLLVFAATSPFVPMAGRRYGLERALIAGVAVLGAGIIVRSFGGVWGLYLGTALVGGGIAVGNVLLPSLLKRDFPNKIAALTGAYSLSMGIAAALASTVMIPLSTASGMGWRFALFASIILPVIALAVWLPLRTAPPIRTGKRMPAVHTDRVWHSPLAWQVTLFLGMNSFIYYVVAGWLPAILAEAGYSAARAGTLHGLMQFATAIPGLVAGLVIARTRDQRGLAAGVSMLSAVSLFGLAWFPQWALAWTAMFGAGVGATFILGLTFVSMRSGSVAQAAALSGMAQSLGYLLAAIGPPSIGAMYDAYASWTGPLLVCALLALAMAGVGTMAGRAIQIAPRKPVC